VGITADERSQVGDLESEPGNRLPNSRYDDEDDGVHHGRLPLLSLLLSLLLLSLPHLPHRLVAF
jgi:hypothetical protein